MRAIQISWWAALGVSALAHGVLFEVMFLAHGIYTPPELLASQGDNASPDAPTVTMRFTIAASTLTLAPAPPTIAEPVNEPMVPPLPVEPSERLAEEETTSPKAEPDRSQEPVDAPPVLTDQQPAEDAPTNPSDEDSLADTSPTQPTTERDPVVRRPHNPPPEIVLVEEPEELPSVELPSMSGSPGVTRGVQLTSQLSPAYPPACVRRSQEGLVLVSVVVLDTGQVGLCTIIQSSGVDALDAEAIRAIRDATFLPALRNDHPVTSTINIPVRFKLN